MQFNSIQFNVQCKKAVQYWCMHRNQHFSKWRTPSLKIWEVQLNVANTVEQCNTVDWHEWIKCNFLFITRQPSHTLQSPLPLKCFKTLHISLNKRVLNSEHSCLCNKHTQRFCIVKAASGKSIIKQPHGLWTAKTNFASADGSVKSPNTTTVSK